jgi:hypothetical protein
MLLKARSRLRCASTADVSALMVVLETWMKSRGSRDLLDLTKELKIDNTWKTAPRVMSLANSADIALDLIRAAPNTCISHKKLVEALMKCDKEKRCLFGQDPELLATSISETLRILLAKYREVHGDLKTKETIRSRVHGLFN